MKKEKCEVIAYWLMGKELCNKVVNSYDDFKNIIDAVKEIEDNPMYPNVGRFSHPNELGEIQLDAAYMDGKGRIGAVIETSHIKNPIEVAYSLSNNNENIVLCSEGADKYALENGFCVKERLEVCKEDVGDNSHDTFGVIQVLNGKFKLAITTSGRKGKMFGRVGDAPLIGSGFYAEDSVGACIATGDGEAVLRNVMAKEVVDRLMLGENIEGICKRVIEKGLKKLGYKAVLSLVAVDAEGNYDVYSTFEVFPFSYINKGLVYNRYFYNEQEFVQDDKINELYKGD